MTTGPHSWLEDQWVYQILESGLDSGVGRHLASSLSVSRKPGTEEVSMLSVVDCLLWCVNTDDTESESPPPSMLPGSW